MVCRINIDGSRVWFEDHSLNIGRQDGPAMINLWALKWYQNGKLHRLDGPAIEHANGDKEWYRDNQLHREYGPAVERVSGTKVWCLNNKLHRLDGPAVEWANGKKEYWVVGDKYTEKEWSKRRGM